MGHDHNKKSIHEYYRMIIYFLNESKHYLCIGDILTRPALKLDCSNSKKDKNKTKQYKTKSYSDHNNNIYQWLSAPATSEGVVSRSGDNKCPFFESNVVKYRVTGVKNSHPFILMLMSSFCSLPRKAWISCSSNSSIWTWE